MSRIGRKPVDIPAGITVKIENSKVTVSNGKQSLEQSFSSDLGITVEGNQVVITRPSDHKTHRALHGLTRSLINNMVVGLSKGFEKKLEINGIGYKAAKQGNKLVMNLGYSHPVEIVEPAGITIEVPSATSILVKGADKQLVGETAAVIRSKRVPDVYKGKGIKYDYEVLRIKEGKTGSKK